MQLRVLVVCPDEEAAELLKTVLAEMEIEVEYTPSVARGLELIEERKFDGILLEYHPDKGSDEFLTLLRQSAKNNDTILMAIAEAHRNAQTMFGLGANFVLYRPLSLERTRLSLHAARGMMRSERRKSPRARVFSNANVSYPGASEIKATMLNISDSGTLITTRNRVLDSGKVYFEFALPGERAIVRLSGQVAWQDSSGRAGIRFMDVPQASRRLMQGWLEKNGGLSEIGAQAVGAEHEESARKAKEANIQQVSHAGDRRREERLPCRVGAEVRAVGGTTPNHCAMTDISESGCYIEMPTPLVGHADVEITIRTAEVKFKIQGEVLSTHPGFGMGVRFVFRDPAEREEILRLLAMLSAAQVRDGQVC
jgi:CheY-like chemotaxis protein